MPETKSMHYRWWTYLKYFAYLAWGWNIPLAWFVIRREITGEKKIGYYCSGIDTLEKSVSKHDRDHASIYQPVNFYTAERLFDQLDAVAFQSTFLDAGCGMGRVMAIAAQRGFKQIDGFDISAAMVYETLSRTATLNQTYPLTSFQVAHANALDYVVSPHVGVIFLFNPFDEHIMQGFVATVKKSLVAHPRPMIVLYANPVHKHCWLAVGFTETHYFKKMTYLEGSVLSFMPKKEA